MSFFRKIPGISFLLVTCLVVLAWGPAGVAGASVLDEVKGYIEEFYVDPVPLAVREADDVQGALTALGDPYSEYFAPPEYQAFWESVSGHYGGIGMSLEERDGYIVVVTSFPGSPARAAGIEGGERILAIDGWEVAGQRLEEVTARIRGEPGTKVELLLENDGGPRRVVLTRQLIDLPGATGRMLDQAIGYVQLTGFYPETPSQVGQVLEDLEQANYQGLVVDLRGNPGGMLESVLEVSSYFLPPGPVVRVVSRGGQEEILAGVNGGRADVPVVVLVDRGTASAAEILAGAMQDYGTGMLVGTSTFGKGSVQTLFELSNGGALKLTTARYLTPRGREVQGKGLTPDYLVDDPEEQLRVAQQLTKEQLAAVIYVRPGQPEIFVGGQKVALEVPPVLHDGRSYVPVEFFPLALGAAVTWRSPGERAEVSSGAKVVEVVAGEARILIDGQKQPLDAPAQLRDGHFYVPLRVVAEALGAQVVWDAELERVQVKR